MKETLTILGKRIAQLRTRKGFTQEKLAEILHYSTNHISKLESARTNPSFELLFAISKALDVELKEIFNFDEFLPRKNIEQEFEQLLKTSDAEQIRLAYKIFRSIND